MKIVQSYCYTSQIKKENSYLENHDNSYEMIFHLMTWSLSCLKLKQHYKDVSLITTPEGEKLLINILKLPYDNVICPYDNFHYNDKELWVLSKLYAYSIQTVPFIHVDGDFFIWKKFPAYIEEAPLAVQNIEINFHHYIEPLKIIKDNFDYVPECLHSNISLERIISINAGIIGGKRLDFFKRYVDTAFTWYEKNKAVLKKFDRPQFNVIFEQLLFSVMASHENISVIPLFDEMDTEYSSLMEFNLIPWARRYIHLVGKAKSNQYAYEQVALHLKKEFPEYYDRIIDLFIPKDQRGNEYPIFGKNLMSLNKETNIFNGIEFLNNCNNRDTILKTKYILWDEIKIYESEHEPGNTIPRLILKWQDQQKNIIRECVLQSWELLLYYFQEPISGYELIELVKDDLKTLSEYQIEEKVTYFITSALIYDGYLNVVHQ